MNIKLEYDAEHDVWILEHGRTVLETEANFTEWRIMLLGTVKKQLDGKRGCLLVRASGLELSPDLADAYGETVQELLTDHFDAILRFGSTQGWTKAQVRLQSVIRNFPSNFFADRETALEALARIRKGS